jgi:hypothetical protein
MNPKYCIKVDKWFVMTLLETTQRNVPFFDLSLPFAFVIVYNMDVSG